jgi:hypothetical protein
VNSLPVDARLNRVPGVILRCEPLSAAPQALAKSILSPLAAMSSPEK